LNYFSGDDENAIEIQIWCALIALVLLLQVLHKENEATLAFTVLTAILRLHLMNYIGIISIINKYKLRRTRTIKMPAEKPPKKKDTPHFMPELQFWVFRILSTLGFYQLGIISDNNILKYKFSYCCPVKEKKVGENAN